MWRWPSRRTPPGEARQRRSFEEPRWRLPHPLAVLKVERGRRTLLGYAENISRGGMMIGTISPKGVGSRYEVEFALPEPEDMVIRCSCRVVWARPYSPGCDRPAMGLEFLDLPETAADRVDAPEWRGERPGGSAVRTWSEYDHAWIRWRPQRVALRGSASRESETPDLPPAAA